MSRRFLLREDASYEVEDDTGILYNVERASNGRLTAMVRIIGRVTIDGQSYSYDRDFRVALKKDA